MLCAKEDLESKYGKQNLEGFKKLLRVYSCQTEAEEEVQWALSRASSFAEYVYPCIRSHAERCELDIDRQVKDRLQFRKRPEYTWSI